MNADYTQYETQRRVFLEYLQVMIAREDWHGETQRRVFLEYLQVMIAREDWHGVADLAMDMRELEAKQSKDNK